MSTEYKQLNSHKHTRSIFWREKMDTKCIKNRESSSSTLPWLTPSLIIIILSFISIHPTTSTSFLNNRYTTTSNFALSSSIKANPHRILSSFPNKKQSNLQRIEASLAQARAAIKKAASMATNNSIDDPDYVPSGSVYRNPNSFHRYNSVLHWFANNFWTTYVIHNVVYELVAWINNHLICFRKDPF